MNVKYFTEESFLKILKGNSHFNKLIEISLEFEKVEDFIKNHLRMQYTESQIKFIQKYFNSKK